MTGDYNSGLKVQEIIRTNNERECVTKEDNFSSSVEGCGTIWDGIYCWPQAKPGELLSIPCPEYISGFDSRKNATKLCTINGWWFNQEQNQTWTNYTDCFIDYYSLYIPSVKMISKIGYGISLVTLIVAFSILAINKRLRCSRNLLHLHLFFSFIMRAFMALLKDFIFFDGVGPRNSFLSENWDLLLPKREYDYLIFKSIESSTDHFNIFQRWECKLFTTVWQYCILANYSWILMEGIYLHNLTFMALFLDTSSIIWHVIMGWTLPALFALPWAVVRALFEDTLCWTTHDNQLYFLIIKVPMVVSILINLVLFLNITRVLLVKLNTVTATRITRYRKWAKSTLILMPLYGVHYALFLGMSYSAQPVVEIIWLFCDQLFGSSQGFCVALLYCILNGEVIVELKRKWHEMRIAKEKYNFPL